MEDFTQELEDPESNIPNSPGNLNLNLGGLDGKDGAQTDKDVDDLADDLDREGITPAQTEDDMSMEALDSETEKYGVEAASAGRQRAYIQEIEDGRKTKRT